MSSSTLEKGSTPRISVTSMNNGIVGYYKDVDSKNYRTYENCISVSFLGTVFYHPYRASFDMKVHCLKPIDRELRSGEALYLVACIQKLVNNNTYGNQTSSTDLPYMKIHLPVDKDGEPDWNYMQKRIEELEKERIEELEKERIEELEKYLLATGLNDYQLTDEDIDVLSLASNGANKEFREFLTSKLFDIHPTKAYKMSNSDLYKTKGNTPVLSNSSTNNGVGGYSGLKPTEDGNIITFSDTTTGTDTMFHQSRDFIGYPHVQGMYPYDKEHWDEKKCLYFIGAMKAACGDGWSYSNKFTRKFVSNTTPLLPIQTDKDNNPLIDTERKYHPDGYIPDWDFMEKYIRAIEKVVIADVVKYKDEVIAKTKTTVG